MMTSLLNQPVTAWVITWLIHSTVLLCGVWLYEKLKPASSPRFREYLWRLALGISFVSSFAVTQTAVSDWLPTHQTIAAKPTADARANPTPRAKTNRLVVQDRKPTRIAQAPALSPRSDVLSDVRGQQTTASWKPYLSELFVLFWGLIASFLLVRFWVTLKTVIGLLGPRNPVASDHRAALLLRSMAHKNALIPLPQLTCNSKGVGPISLPGNEICLPVWAIESLSDDQLKAVIAHEYAHCRRMDAMVLLVSNLLRRLFFFQPFLHVAHHHMSDCAELIADELAVKMTGDHRSMAESLTECASRSQRLKPAWGAAMADSSSSLLTRVQRLIEPNGFVSNLSFTKCVGALALAIACVLILPSFGVADEQKQKKDSYQWSSVHDDAGQFVEVKSTSKNGVPSIKINQRYDDYQLSLKSRGNFSLNDAETDVANMDARGYLRISEVKDGTKRKADFHEKNGEIHRAFWLDGKEVPQDADVKKWLAELLPRVMRETGINAENRVSRIHRINGAEGVLDEIELIRGDHAVRKYSEALIQLDPLRGKQFTRLLNHIGNMNSDFEVTQALLTVATHKDLDKTSAASLLGVAENIDSDFELGRLSKHLLKHEGLSVIAADQMIALIAGMDSDFEMRNAFSYIVRAEDLRDQHMTKVLQVATDSMDSDFELNSLLQLTAGHIGSQKQLSQAYVDATEGLDSDFERKRALVTFAQHAMQDTSVWESALSSAMEIDSDFECAETLSAFAKKMPWNDRLIQRYQDVVREIDSDFHRRQAESALDQRSKYEL